MVAQLRNMANCIGLTDNVSILNDFFACGRPRPGTQFSLSRQISLLRGRHIHLNIIRVGLDQYTNADHDKIAAAIQITRDIYATVNLGIGRIEYYDIETANANGREHIDNIAEAELLTREWTIPNDGLDVFFVLTWPGNYAGYSPIRGPCDKDFGSINGTVLELGLAQGAGILLAHELGHYLGLPDEPKDNDNLMFRFAGEGTQLTAVQGDIMRAHCFCREGCQG
jgi:hypothetical protein